LDTLIDMAIPVAVIIIMIALGLGVTHNDFRIAFSEPKAFLMGVAAQLILVPLIVLVFLTSLQPEREIALGIMILALCPGGAMSNILTRIAGGDVALSLSMTAITNVVSVVTMQTLVVLAANHIVGAEVNASEIQEITVRVALIGTAPILLGMALRFFAPVLAQHYETSVFRIALTVFLLIMGWGVAEGMGVLYEGMILLGWHLLAVTCTLFALGMGIAWLGRLTPPRRIALTVEIAVQNSALGIAVGAMLWSEPSGFPVYVTPAAVYGFMTYITVFPLVLMMSRASKST